MTDTEAKYLDINFEFSKLRSRFRSLRENYINLKNNFSITNEKLIATERTIRGLDMIIDGLKFRNNQATKRINFLQEEMQNLQSTKPNKKSKKKQVVEEKPPGLDIFIETTKNQLVSVVEENEQLLKQLKLLNFDIQSVKDQKDSEISLLKKENDNLRQSYKNIPAISTTEPKITEIHTSFFIPSALPRKIIEKLNYTMANSLFRVYSAFKSIINRLVKELQSEYRFEYYQILTTIESGLLKVDSWHNSLEISKNRFNDMSMLIKPLIWSLSALIAEIKFALENYCDCQSHASLAFLTLLYGGLLEIDSIFVNLTKFSSETELIRINDIQNLLLLLKSRTVEYSDLVKKPLLFRPTENIWVQNMEKILENSQESLSESFDIFSLVVESEIPILHQYGWFPATFVAQNGDMKAVYNQNLGLMQECNQISTKKDDKTTVSIVNCDCSNMKKRLDEATKLVHSLNKEKQYLNFQLKEINLYKGQKSNDDDANDIIKELKGYLETQLDEAYANLQELSSLNTVLESDLRISNLRLTSCEASKHELENELKRANSNYHNLKQELDLTKSSYENHLIQLSEEICHLRKNN